MKSAKPHSYLFIKLLIVTVGFFSLHACKPKDQDCYQSVVVLDYSRFLLRQTKVDTLRVDSFTTKLDTTQIFPDSFMLSPELLAIQENPTDSTYRYVGIRGSSILSGPLDPDKDSIRYRFTTDTNSVLADTLTFFYTPVVHFINNSCGYTYYYNLTGVKTTQNMLDSASIINASVSGNVTSGTANVNFYFKKQP